VSWAKRLAKALAWVVATCALVVAVALLVPEDEYGTLAAAADVAVLALVAILGVQLALDLPKRWRMRKLKRQILESIHRESLLTEAGWSKWADGLWTTG
jgi:hypothetical protein